MVPRSRAISTATRGVLFLGTPHSRVSQTSFIDTLRKIQSTTKLSRATKLNFKELSDYSSALNHINESFIDAAQGAMMQSTIKIFSVYETVGSLGLGIVRMNKRTTPFFN